MWYLNSIVWEFKNLKSQTKRYCDNATSLSVKLDLFDFARFVTNTIGLVIGTSSFSLTGAMIPWRNSSSKWWRKTSLLYGGNRYGLWCFGCILGFNIILCWTASVKPRPGFSFVTKMSLFSNKHAESFSCWSKVSESGILISSKKADESDLF